MSIINIIKKLSHIFRESGSPFFDNLYSQKFEELFGSPRDISEEVTEYHKNLASSMQTVMEELVINKLNDLYEKYQIKNLCLAGGCAFNSSLNGKILKNTKYNNIYISPNVGDAGGAIGSALVSASRSEKKI